jgi:hypothetical protein
MNIDALLESKPVPTPLSEQQKQALLKEIENELDLFDQWFQSPISEGGCGNEPLVRPEKAILRTYLAARMTGRFPSGLENP